MLDTSLQRAEAVERTSSNLRFESVAMRTLEAPALRSFLEHALVATPRRRRESHSRRCNGGTVADSLRAAMRKVSQFKLIVKTAPELLEEEVNLFLQKQGYELHGSPFGSAECFGQALVKYEQAHPTGLPSTLQSHG